MSIHSTLRADDPKGPGCDPAAACTLPADGLEERLAWIRSEILPHAIETARLERGLAFELVAAPGLAAKLDRLIELERECCAGIVLERVESARPAGLRLEVRGIDPDAAVFRSLQAPGARARIGGGSRLAKAAATGVLTSAFVCCVLPVAAVALLGGVAAPLVALDGPVTIAAGALAGGAAAWWWLGRRRAGAASRSRRDACGPGC